jgi:hypothetical protein
VIGTKLGHYDIVARLGAGGMGEVYRARDTRLGRDVALKLLPPALAADPDRLRRFELEAKTLAALNHPHIAQIYGVERMAAGGRETSAIVMECVAGRTLDKFKVQRPASSQPMAKAGSKFEVSDAVSIAAQIALALEAAHDAGIVHRDLKPANVIVRDDGVVKVLDFGLAKTTSEVTEGTEVTETSPAMTQAGVILGTAAYMSPEQARGRIVDRRADIWAFGVVLFEMLTGERLFAGETVTEVLAAVLKDPVRLERLPPGIPASLRQLIGRCLERDPRMRLRDIGEARIALSGIQTGEGSAPAILEGNTVASRTSSSRGRRALLAAMASLVVVALAAIAAYVAWQAKPSASIPVRRFELPAAMALAAQFAISPDGSRIAYFAQGHLFVHTLAAAATADLGTVPPGMDGPLWSPDGRRIAYAGESELRIIPAEGGPPFTVCRIAGSGQMTKGWWHDDGTIYFAVWRESLYRVPASGGTPERVAAIAPEKEIDFHSVAVLPDGRLVVTTHLRGEDAQRLDLVQGGVRTALAEDLDIDIVGFRAPNELVFVRLRTNPGVWTVPFGGGRIDLTRATLLEAGARDFSVSGEGTLVSLVLARPRREFVWVEHGSAPAGPGQATSTRSVATMPGAPFEVGTGGLALSRDGRRAVFGTRGSSGREEYVVRDLSTGRDTRVPAPKAATGVVTGGMIAWAPTGRLLYPAGGVEALQIFDWPSDGSATGRPLVAGMLAQMTPENREILFTRDERSHYRLYRAPIRPDGTAGDAVPVFPAADDPSSRHFELSPDGTLLAFTDVEPVTRRYNIFITTWPDLRERQQVTTDGAGRPRFSSDSRRVFYPSGNTTVSTGNARAGLRVVTITRAPLSIGTPKLLMTEAEPGTPITGMFAVGANDRLLMTRVAPESAGGAARMVLLQNWRGAAGR